MQMISVTSSSADELSDRERDVVAALIDGYVTNRQIAHRLCVSRNTVRTHLSRIFSKVQVNSRTELVLWAIQSGEFAPNSPKDRTT